MRRVAIRLVAAALAGAALVSGAAASGRAGLSPKIGTQLDTSLVFSDETGTSVTLAALGEDKPLLVLLGYDRCPNLCGLAQLDLAQALKATGLPTDQYRVLFASIDPGETPADASAARAKLADATGGIDLGAWRFVTGDASQDAALEAAVGMTVADVPDRNQYVHPIAVAAFTPSGRLAQVLSGVDYTPGDLRLAVVGASEGKLGTLVDRFVLLCHAFDPFAGQYTGAVMTSLRLAGMGTIVLLGGGIFLLSRRSRTPPAT